MAADELVQLPLGLCLGETQIFSLNSDRFSGLFILHPQINLRTKDKQIKGAKIMNWVRRKIYLYNVTFGLYMLDWWERCLFNTLVLVLIWFVFFNGIRSLSELGKRQLW